MTVVWLVLAGLLIIGEMLTIGFILLWFAIGSVLAAITSFMGFDFYIQVIVFATVSTLLLIFTRPITKRIWKNENVNTNIAAIIGKKGLVVQQIDNVIGQGQVKVEGDIWSARSEEESNIDLDTQVEVTRVDGVKLIVKRVESL